MKKLFKILIIWTPIVIVIGQVFGNLLYMIVPPQTYAKWYPYIGTMFGINLPSAAMMVAFTFHFDFCKTSRWAAIAQVIFCVVYLVIPNKELYNTVIQVIVGTAALILTFITFILEKEKKWMQAQSQGYSHQ